MCHTPWVRKKIRPFFAPKSFPFHFLFSLGADYTLLCLVHSRPSYDTTGRFFLAKSRLLTDEPRSLDEVHRLHRPQPNLNPSSSSSCQPCQPRTASHSQQWMPYSLHARRLRLPPHSPSRSNTQRWTWTGPCSCTSLSFASSLEQYCWGESSHAARNGATRSLWYNRRQYRVSNHVGRSVQRNSLPCLGANTRLTSAHRQVGLNSAKSPTVGERSLMKTRRCLARVHYRSLVS